MLLSEIMDKAPKYEVLRATASMFMTEAEIGGRVVKFMAEEDDDSWEISFAEKTEKGSHTVLATGSGSEFQVFAFVKASLTEFIERYKPEVIGFTSAKSERSRSSIYRRIMAKFPAYKGVPSEVGVGGTDSDFFQYELKSVNESFIVKKKGGKFMIADPEGGDLPGFGVFDDEDAAKAKADKLNGKSR